MGTGIRENYYDVCGIRTRVLEAGTGHPLILLHGTGGHAETYLRNIGPLSQHFRVLAMDMVGHGYTDRPAGDYTMDTFADHVCGLIDTIGRAFLPDLLRLVLSSRGASTVAPALSSMLIYLIMTVVLVARPQGLFPVANK